ncbi:hypothetical protein ACFFLS_16765 [Flavobacterium procerum]|uniref:Lipoprotein n=1 Tax=Flavobacterium procerum TaxID=1455569 RepID=A0ABV6BUK1_9FLAO
MKQFLIIVLVIITMSCKNEKTRIPETKNEIVTPKDYPFVKEEQEREVAENNAIQVFPQTGRKPEDFVPEIYEIQLKAEGLLDNDELKDMVIVLQNKNDKTDSRPILVLIKKQDGTYILKETSWKAIDAQYTDGSSKMYDYENIEIDENRIFHITLQGIGPIGARKTSYKYVDDELILVAISTLNTGAGAQITVDYNLISGVADMELADMMQDTARITHEIKKFKLKRKMLFATDSPDKVLEELPHAGW